MFSTSSINRCCKLTFVKAPEDGLNWPWADAYMAKAQILIDVPVKDTDRKETVELSTGGDAAFNGDMHRTSAPPAAGSRSGATARYSDCISPA